MGTTHICHITTAHPQTDIRIFHKQCRSLVKAGYRVTLLVGNGKDDNIDGVRIVGVPVPASGRFSRFLNAGNALYKAARAEQADLYHFHDPDFLRFSGRLTANGAKVVFDSHENVGQQILSKHYLPTLIRGLISKLYIRYEKRKAKGLSAVIGATKHITSYFSAFHPVTETVENFPMLEELPQLQTTTVRKDQVTYVGSISAIRGAFEMIEMLEHCNLTLKVGGGFSPQSLQAELQQRKAWSQVEYLGYLNRDEVWNLYSESKAGLVLFKAEPNHLESQPNKMFEYMMAGLPVIGSNFPMWKEIIEGVGCGLCVDPENTEDISKAVNSIVSDPAKAEQMGGNGRQAVERQYNWKTQEEKLLLLYNRLLNG